MLYRAVGGAVGPCCLVTIDYRNAFPLACLAEGNPSKIFKKNNFFSLLNSVNASIQNSGTKILVDS